MKHFAIWLSGLKPVRPKFEHPQEEALQWLSEAHTLSEQQKGQQSKPQDFQKFLSRFGCSPQMLSNRGAELSDFTHTDFSEMEVFNLGKTTPQGADVDKRMAIYQSAVRRVYADLYPDGSQQPDEIFHVSCTGYASPSVPQEMASRRGWHRCTQVTHLYHMGCYASLPAVRMASGSLLTHRNFQEKVASVDVVHNELCTLFLDPSDHSPEQLVVQSLFADGHIKYSLQATSSGDVPRGNHLQVLALRDEIVPNSLEEMTWNLVKTGFKMTLSRHVPRLIRDQLSAVVSRLLQQAGVEAESRDRILFAVHPGGPRIIDGVQEVLGLQEWQVTKSKDILYRYGNMSSATLPHIWDEILKDPEVPDGTLVVSFAFGPGLTICSGLFRVTRR